MPVFSRQLLTAMALAVLANATQPADDTQQPAAEPTPVQVLQAEAKALRPLAQTKAAKVMLDAVAELPAIEPRVVYYNRSTRNAISIETWQDFDEQQREHYDRAELGEQFYYNTRYGTPLAYVRLFDLVAGYGAESFDGKRVFDFGYGTIGHLRLLASIGAHVVGSEVDPLLREIYSQPDDTGYIPRAEAAGEGDLGSITLYHGFFPADPDLTESIGGGYDLFVSKNTLKKGYIHPEREVDPRMLVHLGVDDETYVRALHDMLNPGGYVMIYNLYPAPAAEDEPYKPWADGRSPFPRELFEAVGFEIIAYNADDTEAARRMAVALGWDEQMNL
jgi:hypothetical protein